MSEPVYPNEAYPADAAVLSLDGTVDEGTGLAYVAKGVGPTSTPTYEVQYNRRLQRANRILAAVRQGMVVDEGGLKVGVYPVDYTLQGVRKSFLGATGQAVPDDVTRVVYVDENNALQIQTSFPSDVTTFVPLATVVAAAGAMTIRDERPSAMFEVSPVGLGAKSIPVAASVYVAGTLSVGVPGVEWVAPFDLVLRNATGRVATAPSGADVIVDVRVNGTSVYGSQADMMVIADGAQQDTSATVDAAVSAGDVITLEVEQVGSSTAGADLTVVLNALASLGAV